MEVDKVLPKKGCSSSGGLVWFLTGGTHTGLVYQVFRAAVG